MVTPVEDNWEAGSRGTVRQRQVSAGRATFESISGESVLVERIRRLMATLSSELVYVWWMSGARSLCLTD